jgi:hypothetical protein
MLHQVRLVRYFLHGSITGGIVKRGMIKIGTNEFDDYLISLSDFTLPSQMLERNLC